MTPKDERMYAAGRRAAYMRIANEALRELDGMHLADMYWRLERADTVAMLREMLVPYGEEALAWPDDMHLADVLSKYLAPHLEDTDDE